MASNNRKAPQRWPPKNNDDRNRHPASRAQQAGSSLHAKRRVDNKKVQETLDDMFVNIFDSEIIRSVAHSCGWKLNKSIEALIMLAEGSDFPDDKSTQSFGNSSTIQTSFSSCRSNEKLSTLSKTKFGKDSSVQNVAVNDSDDTNPFLCKSKPSYSSKTKSVMMNASQGTIKVTYKGRDDPDLSDDDADVVIEEENECDISELDLAFADVPNQSVCQFLTPFLSHDQSLINGLPGSLSSVSRRNIPSSASNKFPSKSKNVPGVQKSGNVLSSTQVKKTKHWPKFERIKKQINEGIKVMILMRGCPGSGKTSLARHIIKVTYGENDKKYVFSTDDYFFSLGNGKYSFDPRLLPTAHEWNQKRVNGEARKGTNPIIIDNTNLEAWEMEPYVKIAVQCGYNLELLEPRTSWRNNAFELERKNTHNVLRRKIEDMLARFQRDLTPSTLFSLFNLNYSPYNKPPQYTSHPRPSLCQSETCTKKKYKLKKKVEGNSNTSFSKLPTQNDRNIKQIQLSDALGCDVVDREIKESLDKLLSEWNRSVTSLSVKENLVVSESVELAQESSAKLPSGTREDVYEFDAPRVFTSEDNGDEEEDLKTDSAENSNDEVESISASDDWDDGSEDDEDAPGDSNPLLNKKNETVTALNFESTGETICMEYALVLKDGTLLPQRSYQKQSSSQITEGNDRVWEYLLMTDDSKLLLNHPIENSENHSNEKGNIEVTGDGVINNTPISTSSVEGVDQINVAATRNVCTLNSADRNCRVECLVFPDIDVEGESCHNGGTLKGFESKEKPVIHEKSNDESLGLLVGENTALLNIVFVGTDDSIASEGAQCASQKINPKNDFCESEQSLNILTSISDTLESNSLQHLYVTTKETSFGNSFQNATQCTEVTKENVQNSFCISVEHADNNSQEYFENNVKPETSETESYATKKALVENDSITECDDSLQNMGVREMADAVLYSPTVCQEHEDKCEINNKENIEKNVFAQNINKNNESDILEIWAEGTSWDDREVAISEDIKVDTDSSAPKPARSSKRTVTAESSSEKTHRDENVDVLCKEAVCESWGAVDEPITSWEVEKEQPDSTSNEIGVGPQPQRQIFASTCEEEIDVEKISVEESESSTDNKDIIRDHENVDITHDKPSTIIDNLIELPAEVESSVVNSTTHHSSLVLVQTQTVTLNEDSLSTTCDLYNDSCSNLFSSGVEPPRNVAHSSTNTHHSDFIMLSNVNTGSEDEIPELRILPTFSRNIIDNESAINSQHDNRKVGQTLMLDKSSMTYDIISSIPEIENRKEQLQELVSMFPHCSVEDLQEIYEKCNKDINWTVDLLLESASQGIEISTPKSIPNRSEPQTDILVDINSLTVSEDETQYHHNESITEGPDGNFSVDDISSTVSSNLALLTPSIFMETSVKSPSPNKRNGKKDRTCVSEMSLLLKKQLEENIVINDEHYSEHVSRLRKLRHGELNDVTEIAGGTQEEDETYHEYTQQQSLLDVSSQEMLQQVNETSSVLRPEAPEWELNEIDCKGLNDEEEESVFLKMDSDFAEQLHKLFGTASLPFNQDMKPTLNLPLSLARQLHYYMMEAEQNTYDLMMQEDEELARKLQLQEDNVSAEAVVSSVNQVPDLREIMDMEMALALYKADQKQSTTENKEDLATKLTKNLLCEWFPTLPRDVLVNVFEAHNHSFEDTLEVLLASTEEDNSVRIVMTPEARAAHEQALLMKASQEGQKSKEYSRPYSVDTEEISQEQALKDANIYRSEANRHYSLRNECQQKAQNAYQRGLTAAASYYSQMASLHKERIEENNAKAASTLLLAHSLGNLTTTLDLHFLYVVEALQVLDMFLDHHIQQLLESSHRSVPVFVITGRGARSTGGRSRIKPAVVQRLEQRGFRHEEVNPGLLRVTITRNATSSNRITS